MVPFWASSALGERVRTLRPAQTGVEQAGTGLGKGRPFCSTSTRHMRQLAAMDSFLW